MKNQKTNPKGKLGIIISIIKETINSYIYKKTIKKYLFNNSHKYTDIRILDIGSGSGAVLKILYKLFENAKIYGLEPYSDMVEVSKRLNKKRIKTGRIMISKGDINNLPYAIKDFEIVTSFNTIDLWDNMQKSIMQVRKVLKDDGVFMMVNEVLTNESNYVNNQANMKYKEELSKYGFKNVKVEKAGKNIVVISKKH